jgi:hypothetical protein
VNRRANSAGNVVDWKRPHMIDPQFSWAACRRATSK